MILHWRDADPEMPSLQAEPQLYDAFAPVGGLILDARPVTRHPDREAVAGYLAFGRWTSGDLVLPQPMSPFVADAIEDDARPVRIRPRDIDLTPRALPQGSRSVTLRLDLQNSPGAAGSTALEVVPSTAARGVSPTGSGLVVPSNAFVLDYGDVPSIRARLAVAVLFAEDVDADALHLEGFDVPADEAARLTALLHSVNLEFSTRADGRKSSSAGS